MIKRIFLLFAILLSISAFSQTKKKKTVKKQTVEVDKKEPKVEEKIIIETQNSYFNDASLESAEREIYTIINEDENKIHTCAGIEVMPEFEGGKEKMNLFISSNFQITDEMKKNNLNGKVIVSFVVEKDGSISNINVIRSLGFGTENEAIRVLKSMPKWNSGEQNGKKVRCSYMVPIMIYATKQE